MKRRLVMSLVAAVLVVGTAVKAQPVTFEAFAATHAKWCSQHPDRVRYLRTNPAAGQAFVEQFQANDLQRMEYGTWAAQHPGWVNAHKDRNAWFLAHPEDAEKHRAEWFEHQETKNEYQDWLHSHEHHDHDHPGNGNH